MPRIIASWREVAAGAFILAALAGALYLVYRAVPWARSRDVHLHAVLQQSYGLRDGSPVRVAGVTVGRVTSARVLAGGTAPGRVRVDFFVRESLEGERLADLFPEQGPQPAKLLAEGGLLPGGQSWLTIEPGAIGHADASGSRQVAHVIEPADLRAQVDETLAEIKKAAASVTNLAESFGPSAADGRTVADRISAVAARLEELIGTPASDVPARGGTVAAAIASADAFLKSLSDPHAGTVGRLVSTAEVHEKLIARLDRADEILSGMQQAVAALTADARRLLDATTKLADRANRAGAASVVTGDDASGAHLEATLAAAERTLANLEAASARLPAAADAATGAIEGGRRVVLNAEDLIAQSRRNWLLRGLFSETTDPWLRLYDFGEDAGGGK